ncbi:DUF6777 domain-containing protein [Frankia sp. Cppng1_Ct_nod]|uniref:DUF6777 domain-containing protein n=1 Tax=Frankia sp. Cppng1_Ct_nod TaxID=2897162 RepID=UPI0032E9FCF6
MSLQIIFAIAVIAGGTGFAVVHIHGGAKPGVDVDLTPASASGTDPFARTAATDRTDVTPPRGISGAFRADTAGLYGGIHNVSTCDTKELGLDLTTHPDRAAAWAGVLGILPVNIPDYLADLTPVLLQYDTYLTKYSFVDGKAQPVPAVIQAGTAVIVDKFGQPVTKCNCGNPLTQPTATAGLRYVGTPWPAFSRATVTSVTAVTVTIASFTLRDLSNGMVFDRPIGTSGADDGPAYVLPQPGPSWTPPTPTTGPSPSPPPSPSTPTPTPTESSAPQTTEPSTTEPSTPTESSAPPTTEHAPRTEISTPPTTGRQPPPVTQAPPS